MTRYERGQRVVWTSKGGRAMAGVVAKRDEPRRRSVRRDKKVSLGPLKLVIEAL